MHFTMGGGALAKFAKMNKALNDCDWTAAAREMKDSKW